MTTLTEALIEEIGRDEPVGLLGQLLYVFAGSGGDAAGAIGVTPTTYNRWVMAARGHGGTQPSAASRRKISRAVAAVTAARWKERNPHDVTIRARIAWNGYYNTTKTRTTRLNGLILDHMFDAYATASNAAVVARFLAAVKDRYGVPVKFTNIESLMIR